MKHLTTLLVSLLFLSACKKEDPFALTKNPNDFKLYVADDTMYLVNNSKEQIDFYSVYAQRKTYNQLCRVKIPSDTLFHLAASDTFRCGSKGFKTYEPYVCVYPFELDSNVEQITLSIFDHYYWGNKVMSVQLKWVP